MGFQCRYVKISSASQQLACRHHPEVHDIVPFISPSIKRHKHSDYTLPSVTLPGALSLSIHEERDGNVPRTPARRNRHHRFRHTPPTSLDLRARSILPLGTSLMGISTCTCRLYIHTSTPSVLVSMSSRYLYFFRQWQVGMTIRLAHTACRVSTYPSRSEDAVIPSSPLRHRTVEAEDEMWYLKPGTE